MLRPISKWEKEFFFNCIIIQQYRVQNWSMEFESNLTLGKNMIFLA
jgi:hypothetical protein